MRTISVVCLLLASSLASGADSLKETKDNATANERLQIVCREVVQSHWSDFIEKTVSNEDLANAIAKCSKAWLTSADKKESSEAASLMTDLMTLARERKTSSHRSRLEYSKGAFTANRKIPATMFPEVEALLKYADSIVANPSIAPDASFLAERSQKLHHALADK